MRYLSLFLYRILLGKVLLNEQKNLEGATKTRVFFARRSFTPRENSPPNLLDLERSSSVYAIKYNGYLTHYKTIF